MATELNTDIAAEVNISARRNDTFKLVLEVKDSNGLTMDLSSLNSNTSKPVYQAKMSIMSLSGEQILNIYSTSWHDVNAVAEVFTGDHPYDRIPSATLAGFFTGGGVAESSGAINLVGQITTGDTVSITVPYTHMAFQSGKYKYDLQLRKNPVSGTKEYTTWLYGSFTLKADITQI
tara:strand:+ start:511 stop:1038 length:528 start_codon:yes stop_codon:yes gene_type:complete